MPVSGGHGFGDTVPHVLFLPPGDREWIVWSGDSGAIVRRVENTRCDKESPAGQTLQGTANDARRMKNANILNSNFLGDSHLRGLRSAAKQC
jgi:hypothetical protein